jgi:predicted O-linked N-acetylglucosamine transferase (SPINDLY family)
MASFGNTYKITPEMFDTWLQLLKHLPEAVLWLIDDNEASTRNLRSYAFSREVGPERIVFSPRTGHTEFCSRLKLADVFLDTYPYNCGSTSNDVLNAGIPLVTLYGKTLVSRMGLSLLKSLQLDSLATSSYKNYKEKVLEVAEMSMVDELRININDGELLKISYIDK